MKVLLLSGGRSDEHAISVASAACVAEALDALGHDQFALRIERDGTSTWQTKQGSLPEGLVAVSHWRPDVAFIAMHGADGEDGRIQAALELLGIPYVGSGVHASSTAIDKARTKAVYRQVGLPVALDRELYPKQDVDWGEIAQSLGLPLVLKTAVSGSSVGVELVQDLDALSTRGQALLNTTHCLVIEAWLPGREFTVPVLENLITGLPEALPLIEIRPRSGEFFDYEAKYTPDATDEICPAPISESFAASMATLGLQAHRALGCRGFSRTDIRCDATGRPHVLETNTLPGLTTASLFPKAASAAGLSFPELIDRLLRLAMRPSR